MAIADAIREIADSKLRFAPQIGHGLPAASCLVHEDAAGSLAAMTCEG